MALTSFRSQIRREETGTLLYGELGFREQLGIIGMRACNVDLREFR